jgi:hypothetical protein
VLVELTPSVVLAWSTIGVGALTVMTSFAEGRIETMRRMLSATAVLRVAAANPESATVNVGAGRQQRQPVGTGISVVVKMVLQSRAVRPRP